jgi:hypothetical protein
MTLSATGGGGGNGAETCGGFTGCAGAAVWLPGACFGVP